jgi:hypothetical protein
MDDFAIFILTHGRPDKVITINSLKRHGYTGNYYLVIDDEDKTADKYKQLYGDKVIQFSKEEIAQKFDKGDNYSPRNSIVYARNAAFDIAEQLGVTYFMELDDDYTEFSYRVNDQDQYQQRKMNNMDAVITAMLKYYKSINAKTIAFSQGGDFIGGKNSAILANGVRPRRKAMNSFICSTKRRFWFVGTFNEDVNTYTTLGSRGELFFTIPQPSLNQLETQSNAGGITELYKQFGTYVKSFTTVMYMPSSVKVAMMGDVNKRMHHQVNWRYTVPKIVSEKLKKAQA